jgi:NTE family protein
MVFNFFQMWKKTESKAKLPIADVPLFSSLGPAELELVETKVRRVEFKKGDIVYRIGEKAEAFYIILLGRFRVVNSRNETIVILSQGDYFGESSILLDRPHSATVEAKNDSLVLKIDKKDFQGLLGEIPALSLHLSRTLGHRLTAGASRAETSRTKIISIYDYESDFEKRCFIWNLAASLASYAKKKTVVVGVENRETNRFPSHLKNKLSLTPSSGFGADEIGSCITEQKEGFHFLCVSDPIKGAEVNGGVASLVGYLIEQYEFVIFDLPKEFNDHGIKMLQHSDCVYFLVNDENRITSQTQLLLKEFRTSFGFGVDEIRFIVTETGEASYRTLPFTLNDPVGMPVFAFLPFQEELYAREKSGNFSIVLDDPNGVYAKVIRFLVRELSGKLVGLVLGSGAAFGFAHIGVLKVLEREQIPIDIIAGSSIGALVGAMWASGLNSAELEKIATDLDQKTAFLKIIGFRDFLLPHHGFFRGDQVIRFLRGFLDKKTFQDLDIPVKIVGTNLFTGAEAIFDEGDVVEAIRASISIPGIFRPVKIQNQFFMDGGVVDPLPVKVLNRYGVKKIIAVNVLSASEDHARRYELHEAKKARLEDMIKRKNIIMRVWHALGSKFQGRYQANVFNVLMNTIQFLEYGISESAAASADVLIHPVLADSHWAEFYSTAKFIRRGEEKAQEQLSEIKRLVEEA